MDWKVFITVFGTVFLAEVGDKTQLATLLFATDAAASKVMIFIAASLALVLAAGLGVVAGSLIGTAINPRYLHYVAGVGFIAIGLVTLIKA
ncbi:MAG: TMEM165/GDT1 family protein [Pseudomonadota bacterium]